LLLPATPFGVTPMHAPFEGTITLTPDTYMRVTIETCVSTARHGAKYLLILNWHEGNIPSLAIAAEALHREHGMTVLTVQACYVAEELYGKTCNGLTHGGEIEALAVPAWCISTASTTRPTTRAATRWTSCAARGVFSRCSPTSARLLRPAGSAARSTPPRRKARAC